MRVDGATVFLTIGESAARVRLSPRTIRKAIAGEAKPLRHFRVGRRVVIAETDLAHWLEDHAVTPTVNPKMVEGIETLFPELSGHSRVTQAGRATEKTNAHRQ